MSEESTGANYLSSTIKQFQFYKSLGEKAIAQIPDDALHWQGTQDGNSVSILVGHLRGNMLSRFTDFLTSDGEKSWRERDQEFETTLISRDDISAAWDEGWKVVFSTLGQLQPNDVDRIVYVRNQGHTALEAINRQLAHYAYHIGQIVFIARMTALEEWQSLSIPKNKSLEFNKQKFSADKSRGHYTDEFIDSNDTQ